MDEFRQATEDVVLGRSSAVVYEASEKLRDHVVKLGAQFVDALVLDRLSPTILMGRAQRMLAAWPESPQRDQAIQRLREALMWAYEATPPGDES